MLQIRVSELHSLSPLQPHRVAHAERKEKVVELGEQSERARSRPGLQMAVPY